MEEHLIVKAEFVSLQTNSMLALFCLIPTCGGHHTNESLSLITCVLKAGPDRTGRFDRKNREPVLCPVRFICENRLASDWSKSVKNHEPVKSDRDKKKKKRMWIAPVRREVVLHDEGENEGHRVAALLIIEKAKPDALRENKTQKGKEEGWDDNEVHRCCCRRILPSVLLPWTQRQP
ncbi:hypothetical protein PIB30_078779 [Stylosanthes scabra]|uniref:Uncharacterized protein n=1 Tax=Stylosanthes scabra TaxID=79078 RepID=A0ABU6SSV2_9FABA|nr:hypothetical protein [Stylosanthes scabra]